MKALSPWMTLAGLFLVALRAAAQFTFVTNGANIILTNVTVEQSIVVIPVFVTSIAPGAFQNDYALTSVTIPNSVTSVGSEAFFRCFALAEANIGACISNFPSDAFFECSGLQTINITEGATSIRNNAFGGNGNIKFVSIADSVTNIGMGAFSNCAALRTISLGAGLLSIGSNAFASCAALSSLTLPNSVNNLASDSFQFCTALTNLNIGPCVSNLPELAFQTCFNLATVNIADGASSIGAAAFNDFNSLKTVVIPDSVTNIGEGAFSFCYSLSSVSLGEGVVSIGGSAFYECFSLSSIRIPSSTTTIGAGAFQLCESLSNVAIGQNVNTIGSAAFGSCFSLKSIVIPANVTNLANNLFQVCLALSNVYFQGNAPASNIAVFLEAPATVYYLAGTKGWGTNFDGAPTVMLNGGSLQVAITPPQAIADGAVWRVDNGADEPGGAVVNSLFPGPHVVSFVPVGSWMTPASVTVTIASNQTAKAAGTYSGRGGSVQVTISPDGAVQAGATWTVDGGVDQISGTILSNLPAGSHLVAFKPVPGWTPPPDQFVSVPKGGLGIGIGVYTASSSPTNTLVLLTNGAGMIQHKFSLNNLVVGKSYTVTAVPAAGNIFDAWVGGTQTPYATLANTASYSFTLEPNLVLEANFASNIVAASAGTYKGLFAPAGVDRTQFDSGSFTFTLSKSGALSGKLSIASETAGLSGKFSPDGGAQIVSQRYGASTLTTTLQLDPANQAVDGTVSDGIFVAQLQGYLNPFTSKNKAAAYEGKYTVAIPGVSDPTIGPAGSGFGMVTVSPTGAVSFTGSLADGTPVSQFSALSGDGYWPLYLTLYGGAGSFWGWNYFSNGAVNAFSGASWINPTNTSKTAASRDGFTNRQANLVGSLYNANSHPLLGLTAGTVTLTGGDLPAPITNPVAFLANNKITFTNATDTNHLTLTINPSTGIISGAFANLFSPSIKIPVKGVLLQNQTNAQGYFINNGQSGAFDLETQ